jgi:hypothetical protein
VKRTLMRSLNRRISSLLGLSIPAFSHMPWNFQKIQLRTEKGRI